MRRSRYIGLLLYWSSMFCFALQMQEQAVLASSLEVEAKETLLNVHAREVPMADVLKTISEKTSINLQLRDSLEESISCDFADATLEDVLKRLLSGHSYLLIYQPTDDGHYLPSRLQVLGKHGSDSGIAPSPASDPPPSDPSREVDRYWLENHHDVLYEEFNAVPAGKGQSENGIFIENISEGSMLSGLGLKAGERIDEVNGIPITSREDFVRTLLEASRTSGSARISRWTSDNRLNPIYLTFE